MSVTPSFGDTVTIPESSAIASRALLEVEVDLAAAYEQPIADESDDYRRGYADAVLDAATGPDDPLHPLIQWFTDHPDLIGEGSVVDNAVRILEEWGNAPAEGPVTAESPADLVLEQVAALPSRIYLGANRYTTDNLHVLHLWDATGASYDVSWPRDDAAPAAPTPAHNLFAFTCQRRMKSEPWFAGSVCQVCDA